VSAAVAEIPSPLDAETGIVRWVVDIADDPGEPAIFNCSAKMAETRTFMPLGCFDANGGAGLTREAARGAALGEALERYCSSAYFADELQLGSYREIAGTTRSLSPQELRLFHPHQRRAIKYSVFDEDTLITWTQAFSLTRREPLLVPASIVYVPYYPFYLAQGEQTIGPSISTGQACASDPVSATLRGLYEVIERDAFTIGWLHRLPGRRVNLDSVPRMKLLFEQRFARAHLEYTLLQLATDIEIASVLCVVIDDSFDPPLIATGGAASLDAEEAVRKALVEAAQTRQWAKFLGSQPRPIVIEPDWSNIHDFERHVFLYAHGDMLDAVDFLRTASEEVDLAQLPRSRASGPGALDDARERVEAAGCEVLVVDLTTIDVAASGYSVMKVLVPTAQQLEGDHTHRLLGSPRLFSVPAKLGLEARTYATLNPDPHPYP
jgi:ribosomal protein S12 methylthiotransferase accessory factor